MSADKSGSPPCGIYIRIDDYRDMVKIISDIRQVALVINRSSGYERNMHVIELVFQDGATEKINDLITVIKAQGLVCIISGLDDNTFNVFEEADGYLFADYTALKNAKQNMDEKYICGLMIGRDKELLKTADQNLFDYKAYVMRH